MEFVVTAAVLCVIAYLFIRRNRERAGNAPLRAGRAALRNEIEARASFRTHLYRASVLGTGGFGGTCGMWIPLRGPKRLIVGTDAFMVSASLALREFVFTGRESSIAFSQAPSLLVNRDWIVITTQAGGRQVRLAITRDNLPEVWQALAGTGVTLVPAAGDLEQRATGRRRMAVMFVLLFLFAFIPALVTFLAHHLR
jgi:hypothetical protein